jgi:hypothetical protein
MNTTPPPEIHVDPVLIEPATITIAGATYTVRRLGLRDVFRVSRILGRGIAILAEGTERTATQVLQVLIASMNANEEEVLRLIADIIGVKRTDLDDPNRFPMVSFIDILAALAESQDLRDFFARVQTLTGVLPELQTTQASAKTQ